MQAVQAASAAVVSQAVSLNHGVLVKSLPAMSTPDLTITASQMASGPSASLSQVPASQASLLSAPMCTLITRVTPAAGPVSKVTSGPKVTATQQVVPPKTAQATIQLPANFQIPPGTVLIRSNNGQLMLVSQQALARAQAQVQSAKLPSSSSAQTVHISNVQTAGTPSNVAKVSSSLISKAGPSVSAPTIVRICTTPQTVANSQGTSAVVIRASAPSATAITTVPCTLPSTVVPVPAPAGVSTAGVNTSTVAVVPVRTSSPPVTSVTNNGASMVVPASTVSSTTTPTANSSLHITVNAVNSDIVQTNNEKVAASSSVAKMASRNICITNSTTASSAPIIVSSIAPASTAITTVVAENNRSQQMQTSTTTLTSSIPKKAEPTSKPQSMQPNASEAMDNVKKCKNFLATLIKLASSGPQSPTMGQNVKNLVKNLLDSKLEAEEFTTKLYKELKSSPQPYLVPFLKKSLPSLRRMMPNSHEFILQCGPQNSTPPVAATNSLSFVKITPTTSIQNLKPTATTTLSNAKVTTMAVPQHLNNLKAVNFKQLVVQQPAGGIMKHVTTLPPGAAVTLKPGEKQISLNALIQAGHLTPASVLKQIALPANKVNSLQASLLPIKENGTACFREEDDINDVTSMAGVNLNEENACILATNSELVGAVIRSCKDEPFLFTPALQSRILDIGKRHDIKELNSDVMNLVSHATQERLRGLIEKLTVVAQHRSTNYRQNDHFVQSSEVRAQLKFLEQLEHLERQRKYEEEREMLLRAAKSRSNKEDPEQMRLKQKAKELQQLELEQLQYREANLTALAAIGPRRKRPLESSHLQNVLEEYQGSESSVFRIPKTIFVPRMTRVSLRDLIFCMEQERMSKHSLSLYRALLK